MDSPRFVSLLVIPGRAHPIQFVHGADNLRETETAAMVAWRAQCDLTPEGIEPPLWDTYVRARDVVGGNVPPAIA